MAFFFSENEIFTKELQKNYQRTTKDLPRLFVNYSAYILFPCSWIIYVSMIKNFLKDFVLTFNFKSFLLYFSGHYALFSFHIRLQH